MADIQFFQKQEFGVMRSLEINNQPYFCLTDVCRILDIKNSRDCKNRLNKNGVVNTDIIDSLGRRQQATFINESNLYKVIFQSRKSEAEQFVEWITGTVLPSIRKNGGYIQGQENMSDSELLAKAVLVAQNTIEEKNKLLAAANKKIEEDAGKVFFANSVSSSKSSILVGDLAKILKQIGYDVGQNRLFEWLRNKGYLIKKQSESYNMPTQKAMELGLFEIKESTIKCSNGYSTTTKIKKTVKVTGRGQVYLVEKYAEEHGPIPK